MIYELKPTNNGKYYFQAYGFTSAPFELKDVRQNKQWFRETILGKVEGTVQ